MLIEVGIVLFIVFYPYLATRLTYRLGTENWLSPVILSYLGGILAGNFAPFPIPVTIPHHFSQATILLAIPLLLYSTDLAGWFKLAGSTVLSFLLVIISVVLSVIVLYFVFETLVPDTWMLSGMLAGVYIGGTPNMNAVGIAIGADNDTFIRLNAAEIVCGGAYLLFLTSVAHRFYGLFLPDFKGEKTPAFEPGTGKSTFERKDMLIATGLTLVIAGVALGGIYLVTGSLEKPGWIILLISLFAVVASFFPVVRNLKGAFEAGEYLLLMFCVAIGLLANFADLIQDGGMLVIYVGAVLLLAILIHLLLCMAFGIDRDTMIITQTAGFYGPPFIGQIAAVIQNRNIVFSGIATGLVGLSIANFIGVLLASLLKNWFL